MVATMYLETAAVVVFGTLLALVLGRLIHGKAPDPENECSINLDEIDD